MSIFESSSLGGGRGILGASFLTDFEDSLADLGGDFSVTELEEVGLTGAFLDAFMTGEDSVFMGFVGAFLLGLGFSEIEGFGGRGGGFLFGLLDSDDVVLELEDANGLFEFSSFELSS